jgi:hypothetical protein
MNKYEFTSNGRMFTRVSKAAARKAFVNGFTIAFCPSNLRPGTPWYPELITDRESRDCLADDIGAANEFQSLLNSFEYFNCTTSETGKYTAFFIETGNNYIHLSFSDGSNPWIFYGDTLECMKKLDRWKKRFSIEFQKKHFYMLTERRQPA